MHRARAPWMALIGVTFFMGWSTAGAAPDPAAEPVVDVVEDWRLTLPHADAGGVYVVAIAQVEGVTWAALQVTGTLQLPGRAPITSRGEADVVLLRLDPKGEIGGVLQLGQRADERPMGLVPRGDGVWLALVSDGAVQIGDASRSAPRSSMAYVKERIGLLVAVDAGLAKPRVVADWPYAQKMVLGSGPDGDVLAGVRTEAIDESQPPTVRASRFGDDGARRWQTPLKTDDISAVGLMGPDVFVGTLDRRRLGLARLDAGTGAHEGEMVGLETPFGGDRGRIIGVWPRPKGFAAVGHSGLPSKTTPDGRMLSHPAAAFTLPVDARTGRVALLDAVAFVNGVGVVHGKPAAVVQVVHHMPLYGGPTVPHRGVYLATDGSGAPSFAPIYQVDYEIDDPPSLSGPTPYGKKTPVHGAKLVPMGRAAVGDRTVVIPGLCGDVEVACVARYSVRQPPDRPPPTP